MSAPVQYKCRTCLSEEENKLFHQLYESIGEKESKIVDILDECLPQLKVKAETRLTQHICEECVNKLLSCHRFHQLCIESNNQLLACFKNANQDEEEVDVSSSIEDVGFKVEHDIEAVDDNNAYEILPVETEMKLDIVCKEEEVDAAFSDKQQNYNNTTPEPNLLEQIPIRSPKQKSEHRCPDCNRTFSTSHNLRRHSKRHDPTRPFSCSKCKYTFDAEATFRRHMFDHNNKTVERKFQCPNCPKFFWEKSSLALHARSHERSNYIAYPSIPEDSTKLSFLDIEVVNKKLDNEIEEIKTMNAKEDKGDEERKTVDLVRQKNALVKKQNLKIKPPLRKKRRKNLGKASLLCIECGKKFSSCFSLRRHSTLFHDNAHPYACHICSYRFDTERRYRLHMWFQHKIDVPVEDDLELWEETNLTEAEESGENDDNDGDREDKHDEDFTDRNDVDDKDPMKEKDDPQSETYIDFVDTGIGEVEKPRNNYIRGSFPCNVCGRILGGPHRLKRHMVLHSMDRPYACQLCPCRFLEDNQLRRHMQQHENKPPPEGFPCPNCTRRFQTRSSLAVHRSQVHRRKNAESSANKRKNGDIYYPCKHCDNYFMSVIYLTKHIEEEHPNIEKFECNQCYKTFVLNALLQEHLCRHKGLPHTFCVICEKSFRSKEILQSHMRVHIDTNRFLCTQCGKQLSSLHNLKQHMERHDTEKKWACTECPGRFKCRLDLHKHSLTHRNLKPYVCEICGSSYTRFASLRKHKAKHTGEKPYACDQCDKRFVIIAKLRLHYRTHTGEKPYKCKYCDRAYAQSGDLNKHLRTHVGEKTYMCTQCPEAFKYHAELQKHIWEEHYKKSRQQQQEDEEVDNGNEQQQQQPTLDDTMTKDYHIEVHFQEQEHHGSQMQNVISHILNVDSPIKCHKQNLSRKMSAPVPYKCRTCLSEEENKLFHQLYESIGEKESKIVDILDECLPQLKVKAETRLTQHICQECVNKLLSCHRFHQLCIESNQQLLACFKNANQDEEEVDVSSSIEDVGFKVEHDIDAVDDNNAYEILPVETEMKLDIVCKEEEEEAFSDKQQNYNNTTPEPNLFEQIAIRTPKQKSEHRCPDCNRTFSTSHNLRRHSKRHDPTRPFSCSKCKYTFDAEATFRRHMFDHNNKTVERKFQCPNCPKFFWEKSSLALHARSHERSNYIAYPSIPEDSKKFSFLDIEVDNKKLDNEIEEIKTMIAKEDKGDEERKTVDLVRQKNAIVKKQNLKIMPPLRKKRRKNLGKASLLCIECGKKFSSCFSLRRHSTLFHDNAHPYACHICSYRFDTERRYRLHMWFQHKIDVPVEEDLDLWEETNLTEAEESGENDDNDGDREDKHDEDFTDRNDADDKNSMKEKDDPQSETYIDFVDTGIGAVEKPRNNYIRGNFPCNVCGRILGGPHRLKRHMVLHSMDRPYACQLCPCRFLEANQLRRHMQQHENKPPPDGFPCPNCTRRFQTRSSLAVHRSQVHRRKIAESSANKRKNGDIYYPCKHCDNNFMSVIYLTKHIEEEHPNIEKFECNQCDKAFVLNALLQEHLCRHKSLPHTFCVICEKSFRSKEILQSHMRVHIGTNRFLCTQCGKQLSSLHNLKQHMERHDTEKKWACTECPGRFKCRLDLHKHSLTHRNLKPYVCEICGSSYTRFASLRKHKAKHTGEKPYACDQCDMRFVDVNHLRRHYRTHTGEKPYKCKYCDRAYAQSGDLNKHLRTHVGEKTYMCTQCPEAFKYHAELQKHIWEEHYKKSHQPQQEEEEEGVDKDNEPQQQQETSDNGIEDDHIEVESQEYQQESQMQNVISHILYVNSP
ncbi:uncharacterized protein [Musca autumnalis]|uniref:uncharacterized protein n=1 Tax=Musca autumnalis TaxID=221902 RepID=UPI003CEA6AAF